MTGRIREGWNEIIELHKKGYARSIGVSNYTLDDMKQLIEGGEKPPAILPAVNQIELHPYVWGAYRANVEYCQSKVSVRFALLIDACLPGTDRPYSARALRLKPTRPSSRSLPIPADQLISQ